VDGWFNESIRAAVGLPTRAARFARDAYLLSALAARAAVAQVGAAQKSNSHTNSAQFGASGLAIIAGQLGGDGDPLKPSRLLLPQDELAIAKRILLLLPNDADGVAITRMRPKVAHSAALSSIFAIKPQPRAENKNETPRAISVTDFAVYIDNPYRYWLEKVLKLSAPELDQVELNAAEFGTLLHAAAQSLNTPAIQALDFNNATHQKQCVREIMQVAHALAQKNYGADLTLSIRLALLELHNRLPALVAWHAAQWRAGWRIVTTEWPSKYEDAVAMLDVDGSMQAIKFRVDRIDRHPNHGWRIIDYKSSDGGFAIKGKGAKVLRGDKWIDLQLPLYKFLLPQIAAQHPDLVGLATAASGTIEVGVLSVPASNLAPEWCPLLEPIDGAIAEVKRIVREIRAGNFPDSGRDPSGKFERVRRALCLPMFGEESDDDQDNEGAAT
jgi:ATP-dependent helicase/nuclease subunit B